jgi:hypothetical protein
MKESVAICFGTISFHVSPESRLPLVSDPIIAPSSETRALNRKRASRPRSRGRLGGWRERSGTEAKFFGGVLLKLLAAPLIAGWQK